MTCDKMKLAYLHLCYWGREFQTNVKDEPQAGQMPHALAFVQLIFLQQRRALRRATDGLKEFFIRRGLISTYSWFSTRPPQNATSILNPTAKYLGGVKAEQGCEAFPKPYLIMYKLFCKFNKFYCFYFLLELFLMAIYFSS